MRAGASRTSRQRLLRWHCIWHFPLRILQDQGLVDRTPGLGYVTKARTTTTGGHLRPVAAINGQYGSPAGWGLGGATRGDR